MPKLLMDQFSSPEDHRGLDLESFFQEAADMLELELVVVFLGFGPETDLLKLDRMLLFFGRFFLLGLLVEILSVIHDATDRRPDIGGDLHEIESTACGYLERLRSRHNPDLRAVFIDKPYFRDPYPAICPDAGFVSYVITSV